MKALLLIFIIYLNYVICVHTKLPIKSKIISYPKKVKPFGKMQLVNSAKYLKRVATNKHIEKNKKYTVFPDIKHESPLFPLERDFDNKPRVKKVLPDYVWSSLRNKRSADVKTEAKNKAQVAEENNTKETLITRKTSKTNVTMKDGEHKSLLKLARSHTNLQKKLKSKQKLAKHAHRNMTKVKKIRNRSNRHENFKFAKRPNKKNSNIKLAKNNKKSKRVRSRKLRKLSNKTMASEIVPKKHLRKVDARRLIAGRDALIEDYPYVVSIQKDRRHWCTGALLNPRLVITTANCIWKASRISELRVRAGSRYTDRGGQVVKIQEVMKHPGWSIRMNPDNDVALLLLDKNIRFSHSVHGVDLPNRVMMPAFDDAWITSWGAERRDGVYDTRGITLRVYHARILDRKKCNNVTLRFGVPVTENFICLAQTGERGPCTRDTGAPAVSDGVLWGLASWGIRKLCGTERFPAMFSYLASKSNLNFIINATQYLMSDERYYPFLDRYPTVRASPTTPTVLTLPF